MKRGLEKIMQRYVQYTESDRTGVESRNRKRTDGQTNEFVDRGAASNANNETDNISASLHAVPVCECQASSEDRHRDCCRGGIFQVDGRQQK
jgi:hypothetical protein